MSNSLCLKERSYFFLFGKFKEMNLSIFFLFNSSFPLDFQTHYMNFSEFLLKKCVKTHVFLNSSGLNEPLVIFCLDRICKNKSSGTLGQCNTMQYNTKNVIQCNAIQYNTTLKLLSN